MVVELSMQYCGQILLDSFYNVYLLSLTAKSTFKIIFLGGYVLRIGFFNSQVTKVRNFSQILQPWWISLKSFQRSSRESFPVTNSLIPRKFSRNSPELIPKMRDFLWGHSFETQFREIPKKFFGIFNHKITQNFYGILLWKFVRNS